MGHALLRKVKVLTEENEDLGRQQRESKQAAQVRPDTGILGRQGHCCHSHARPLSTDCCCTVSRCTAPCQIPTC